MRIDDLKIAASSVTPLTGRLAAIFTPRLYVIFASTILAIGLFITATASNLTIFLVGRAVAGIGSGGLMSIAIILAVDLASPKLRGLCIGLINAGYTTGLASGAVLAGLMTSSLGWVCCIPSFLQRIRSTNLFCSAPHILDSSTGCIGLGATAVPRHSSVFRWSCTIRYTVAVTQPCSSRLCGRSGIGKSIQIRNPIIRANPS